MPYDDQNNDYDNQNQNTYSSQTQNLTQTQQTQPNAQKDNLDPKNPNNNIYSGREAINPFFVFSFIKGVIDYFGDLANRIVEKKDYKDGIKSGKAYREKKEAKRMQNEQEDITSPSPQSNEFSMFRGKPTATTQGRDEDEEKRERRKAAEQATKDRQARQAGKKPNGPKRTIKSNPSGK